MKKSFSFRLLMISFIVVIASSGCGSSSKLLGEGSSLMNSLGGNPNLSTFTSLLKTPGLSSLLGSTLKGPVTLLAPTNEAFKSMGTEAFDNLKSPQNVQQIADLVKNGVVPGKLDAASLAKGGLTTAAGNPLDLKGANLGSVMSADNVNIIPIDKLLQ